MSTLKEKGLCNSVHYKEMYIPQDVMEGKFVLSHICSTAGITSRDLNH